MEYKATAFQGKTGRVGGTVRVQSGSVYFESDHGNSVLPVSGLQLKRGGASNRLIFLSNPSAPQVSIYTSEAGILDDLKAYPAVASQVAKIQRSRTKLKAGYIAGALITALLIYGSYIGVGLVYEAAIDSIPVSWEEKLGETIARQIRVQSGDLQSPDVQKAVDQMTKPILEVVDSPYDYKFYVTKDSQVNAFALPGGYIFVNSGLILEADRTEEIQGVLAHEIAHVERRHGLRALVRKAGIFITISFLFGDTEGLFAVLADQGGFLLSQAYSRDLEREADSLGLKYLNQAGIDPTGLLSFFERLKEIEEKMKAESEDGVDMNALSILNTHPATDERIESLKEQIKKSGIQGNYRKNQVDIQKLKDRIRNSI